MPLLAWILLGGITGFLVSHLIATARDRRMQDGLLATLGAVAAGWLVSSFGMTGVTGLNVYSLAIAIVAAGLLAVGYQTLRSN